MVTNSMKEKTHYAITKKGGAFSRYQDVIIGGRSFAYALYFEFCIWLSPVPGALGLFLRKLFWPRLFSQCGTGVIFGRNIILRHPRKIVLGDNTVIGDCVILDGRNSKNLPSLNIGREVMIADYCTLSSKGGEINLGDNCGLGNQTIIQSTNQCRVDIGDDVIIGPSCYIVGGGNYQLGEPNQLIRLQEIRNDGGCKISGNVWVGAKVCILDGASIGYGSVIAAGSVVNKDIASNSICAGIPARIVKSRSD